MPAFHLHRLALTPLLTADTTDTACSALIAALDAGGPGFPAYLLANNLGPLWHARLSLAGCGQQVDPARLALLHRQRMSAVANYVMQRSCIGEIDRLLSAAGLPYALLKGTFVRELIYADPALRPANDIDLLVSPDHRIEAARLLCASGFACVADAANISHEVTLTRGPVQIDLHWDILRPGRTRTPLAAGMLARRVRIGDAFCGLADDDVATLMLVHPAITRYVCSSNVSLISIADLLLWSRARTLDWERIIATLDAAGLKTAAWCQLTWLSMLVGQDGMPVPPHVLDRLRPGRLRAAYLIEWLRRDLPSRWLARPLLIQAGLTLALHDTVADAGRAVRGLLDARGRQASEPLLRLAGAPRAAPDAKL